MNKRAQIIRVEYHRFQQGLRPARWQAISEALELEGERELSAKERDAVDMAAATGVLRFDQRDDGDDDTGRICPTIAPVGIDAGDDCSDLLRGCECRRCSE